MTRPFASSPENPFGRVKRPKVEHKEPPVLTVEQARALVTMASASRCALLFELLITTGMRRGEGLALKWSDVKLDDRTARVRKTLVGRRAGPHSPEVKEVRAHDPAVR